MENRANPQPELMEAAMDGADKTLLGNGIKAALEVQQLEVAEPSHRESFKMASLLRQHWPLLLLLWMSHICIGMGSALPGSGLLQLAKQVGASLSTMGFWFTVKSIACCVLALLTSLVFFRLPGGSPSKAAFLAGGNLASGAAMLGAGLVRSCALALCLAGLLGAGHGALETANSLLAIRAFGSQLSRPILHSLHFSTAVGGLAAPLLLRSFTKAQVNITIGAAGADYDNPAVNSSALWVADRETCGGGRFSNASVSANNSANATTSDASATPSDLRLIGPYTVVFSLHTAVSAGLLVLALRRYHLVAHSESLSAHIQTADTTVAPAISLSPRQPLPVWRQRLLIALTVVFYFAAVGGENIFWSLVSAYGTCSPVLRLDARGAASLHAAFFGGFLVGRGLGIVVSHWARPSFIMLAHLGGCLLALVTLCLATAPWLTYVGTAFFGLCVSVLYATGVTWLEQCLDVVGPIACSWSIGGQLGISVLPALAGYLLVAMGPAVVMHLALGALTTAAATFILMLLTTTRRNCGKS